MSSSGKLKRKAGKTLAAGMFFHDSGHISGPGGIPNPVCNFTGNVMRRGMHEKQKWQQLVLCRGLQE